MRFPGNNFSHFKFIFIGLLACLFLGCKSDKVMRDTAPHTSLAGKGVTLFAAGDIADCDERGPQYSGAAKTAALIDSLLAKDSEAVVLSLGDNTYPLGLLSEFTDCYDPTWGKFKARTYPVVGNHEYYSPLAAGYYAYFGAAAGPGRRGYYSFDMGSWHIVALNSYLRPAQHKAQLEWLQADLAKNTSRCMLAFWHHPRYSSVGHGNNPHMDEAWKMLSTAGAEVVLSSHDHNYERFVPLDGNGQRDEQSGMRQFVVGTGGAKLTPLLWRNPESSVVNNSTHGVLKMVLKDAGYEWEFLPVKQGGFSDSGTALCH